jgi:DNA-binding MarR family transcriptional regulator
MVKNSVDSELPEGRVPSKPSATLFWAIPSLNVALDQLMRRWGASVALSGPQCKILLAISDLDTGGGVPVKDISRLLQVDGSFVSSQATAMTRDGWIARMSSQTDARVVLLSLGEAAGERLKPILDQRGRLAGVFYREISPEPLAAVLQPISRMRAATVAMSRRIDAERDMVSFALSPSIDSKING